MRRWHHDAAWMARQGLIDRRHGRGRPAGFYRKKHALDCGQVRCGVCHSDKYPGRCPHEHEVRAASTAREQMREFAAGR